MATHTANRITVALPALPAIKLDAGWAMGIYAYKPQSQAGFTAVRLPALNSGGSNNCWIGSGGVWVPAQIF